ncbi:MAG: LysM peptidoglycan-binding domain-containing protein [Marinobacterium sp.]|nr:LysM peptidoglycan-binding domain-containing protein [Marinobacterium sp.]
MLQSATPEPPADLWQQTRNNFQFDLNPDQKRFRAQLKWYDTHPKYMNRVIDRASRYYHHILGEVLKRGMPAEIALLPVVESAFDPFAYSHGRASGAWQFIPGTGKRFGLRQSWWYDGRRDIVASTRAALDYLDLLQKRYNGDYLLALAAYNCGEGNVDKAIKRNRRAGKPIDFWSLKLPKETSAYVPKLLAVARIFNNPEEFGFEPKTIPDKPYFKIVPTDGQLDLAEAARLAGINIEELYLLNPGFNRWATDPKGPHYLLIPVEQADTFAKNLAALPADKRMRWDRYVVRRGDSLSTIAQKYKTTASVLRVTNNIKGSLIRVGQPLLIPQARHQPSSYVLSQAQRQLRSQQKIARTTRKRKVNYTVKSGDSFWSISRKYKVNVRSLASWNSMAPRDPLSIGKKLVIWQQPKSSTKLASVRQGGQMVRKIGYRVRSGDSLSRIAGRFKVKISDIQRWNKLDKSKYLQPGQRLTLYVDITR